MRSQLASQKAEKISARKSGLRKVLSWNREDTRSVKESTCLCTLALAPLVPIALAHSRTASLSDNIKTLAKRAHHLIEFCHKAIRPTQKENELYAVKHLSELSCHKNHCKQELWLLGLYRKRGMDRYPTCSSGNRALLQKSSGRHTRICISLSTNFWQLGSLSEIQCFFLCHHIC